MTQGALGPLSRSVPGSLWERQAGPFRAAGPQTEAVDGWGDQAHSGQGCVQGHRQVSADPGSPCPRPGLSAGTSQALVGPEDPAAPSKLTRSERSNAAAIVRFSPWGLTACSGDSGHLLEVTAAAHLVPENTGHVSDQLFWP